MINSGPEPLEYLKLFSLPYIQTVNTIQYTNGKHYTLYSISHLTSQNLSDRHETLRSIAQYNF